MHVPGGHFRLHSRQNITLEGGSLTLFINLSGDEEMSPLSLAPDFLKKCSDHRIILEIRR